MDLGISSSPKLLPAGVLRPVDRASTALASGVDLPSGRERRWELELAALDTARSCLDVVSEQWDQRLGRLKRLVEDDG